VWRSTCPNLHNGGRAEYTTDDGSTWTGAHIYGINNRINLTLSAGMLTTLVSR
jgi:hypothetical protein